jgi:hypothetical protein
MTKYSEMKITKASLLSKIFALIGAHRIAAFDVDFAVPVFGCGGCVVSLG